MTYETTLCRLFTSFRRNEGRFKSAYSAPIFALFILNRDNRRNGF